LALNGAKMKKKISLEGEKIALDDVLGSFESEWLCL